MAGETLDAAEVGAESTKSYTWLKWVSAVVLLVEGLIGLALPALYKITPRATWVLSLLNAFSGGVFLTFGAHTVMRCFPCSTAHKTVPLHLLQLSAQIAKCSVAAFSKIHERSRYLLLILSCTALEPACPECHSPG